MNNRLKLWSVTWATTTAGPSPFNNERTEIFLFGCEKAKNGNPCEGCFNPKLWDNSIAEKDYSAAEIADQIAAHAPNKYVTIGGGEPTDQMDGLIELTTILKAKGFHIMVYTWKSLISIYEGFCTQDIGTTMRVSKEQRDFAALLNNIDMLADGQFMMAERLYEEDKEDGLLNSVGSGNQIIWDVKAWKEQPLGAETLKDLEGYCLRDLDALHIKDNGNLVYLVKDMNKPAETVHIC